MAQGKHSLIYFLGRGLPGIINFGAMALYTRLLLPHEYGMFSLVFATVNLLTTILYQWLRLVLLRFLPKCTDKEDEKILFASIGIGFITSSLISALLLIGYLLFVPNDFPVNLVMFGLLLLWLQALLEMGLDFFRTNLDATRYSIINFSKSILAIVIGAGLAYYGYGAIGLILGLCISILAVSVIYFRSFIVQIIQSLPFYDFSEIKKHLAYGLPLTLSAAMYYVFNTSDRFFISYYLGVEKTGIYSVGYDLAKQPLWIIMMSINLACYPLVVRAIEANDMAKAREQLKSNLLLLLGIAVPAALGLALLSQQISTIFLGAKYVTEVTKIIPLVAIGALFGGIKPFYVDMSFQLNQKTYLQLWSVCSCAIINVILNVVMIPRMGIMGAVYSSIICYILDLVISGYVSRLTFRLPVPLLGIAKILFSAFIMCAFLTLVKPYFEGIWGLLVMVVGSIVVYLPALIVLKVFDISSITNILRKKK